MLICISIFVVYKFISESFMKHALEKDTQYVTDLQSTLSSFWELESIGIKQDSDSVHDKFLEDIRYCREISC